MLLEPHVVTSLKYNGHPLHINVAREENKQHTIHAQGRGSYCVNTLKFDEDVIALLHTAFSHYPSPVTIDSRDVERTPFPDLSTVHLAHAPSMERTWTKLDPHALAHHQAGHPHLNTYTGGILTDLYRGSVQPHRYFTALDGTMPHWRPCAMVTVSPVSRASTKHASGAEQKCTSREVIGQRKCPGQLFGRSVTEAGWQQAGE